MVYRRSSRPPSYESRARPRSPSWPRRGDSRSFRRGRSLSFRSFSRPRSPSYVLLRPRDRPSYERSRSRSFRPSPRAPRPSSRWSPAADRPRSYTPSRGPSFRYDSLERPPKDLEVTKRKRRPVRRKSGQTQRRGISPLQPLKSRGPPPAKDGWSPRRSPPKAAARAYEASPRNTRAGPSRNGHKMRPRPSSGSSDDGPPGTWAISKSKDHYRQRRRTSQEYLQMAAQQVAMMRFMHHPGYMAMMQQQMGMMQPAMMGMTPWAGKRADRDRSSSSDSYSSSHDGTPPRGTMFPVPPPLAGPDVEAFLKDKDLEAEVADRFRTLPPHLQQEVIRRGPLDSRSPTSTLLSRMKQAAEAERSGQLPRGPVAPESGMRPLKQTAKNAIEALIGDFGLSPGCAWMLRSLPPDKQKLAAKIDPTGQPDPSAYVAEELQNIV